MFIYRYDFGAKSILAKIGAHSVLNNYDFGAIGGHMVLINRYDFGAKTILSIVITILARCRYWAAIIFVLISRYDFLREINTWQNRGAF